MQHSTDRSRFGASSIKTINGLGTLKVGVPMGQGIAQQYTYDPEPEGFRIDFWIYVTAFPSETKKILYAGEGEENSCFLSLSPAGELTLQWFQMADPTIALTRNLQLGTWAHVFLFGSHCVPGLWSQSQITLQLAVNGMMVSDTDRALSSYAHYAQSIIFSNLNGYIDDIFITRGAPLTSSFDVPSISAAETNRYITGVVMKGSSYVARTVCAYDSTTKALLGVAISDASTGVYIIPNIPTTTTSAYAIALKESDDDHSLILDPVLMIEA